MELHGIDPALLAEFIDESSEALQSLDAQFVALERSPGDHEIVNAIFRPVHSLKGNAAFFGLLKVKELAHRMENLLDLMRNGKVQDFRRAVDALLPGLDMLRTMLTSVRDGGDEVRDSAAYAHVYDVVQETLAHESGSEPLDRFAPLLAKLTALQTVLPETQRAFANDAIAELQRLMGGNDAKSVSGVMVPREVARLEDLLKNPGHKRGDEKIEDAVRALLAGLLAAAAGAPATKPVAEALDSYETFMGSIGFDALLIDILVEKARELKDASLWVKTVPGVASAADSAKPAAGTPEKGSVAAAEKTMRVAEHSIDAFLSYVEELIVVEEMFNFVHKNLAVRSNDVDLLRELRRTIETFGSLSNNLQHGILSIRKVPVRTLLQKAPRLVRDTAAAAGKEADIVVVGDDVLVDKSYIDLMDAPLTHIVRNSVDHGIEPPSERVSLGKSRAGRVTVSVVEHETEIEFSFADDGRGLNYEKLTAKARQLGLVSAGQSLSTSEVVNLLFMPGVSTAETVTDISGRGVGMDVAKRNIDTAGGRITVESTAGSGSVFRLFVPRSVSTRIIDGFLVSAGGIVYVLPMEMIGESFAAQPSDLSSVAGNRAQQVLRRGELLPVADLQNRLTGVGEAARVSDCITLVSVDMKGNKFALAVDHIVGVQKVVVKPLDGALVEKDLFDGAAMMGDGSVAMIIGAKGIAKLFA